GLHALELDAVVELVDLDALQHAEEVEVPPRAAVLAIGRELETDVLLLLDDLVDLAVLDRLEVSFAELARLVLGTRVLDRGRAQDAADMVGTVRRLGSGGHRASPVAQPLAFWFPLSSRDAWGSSTPKHADGGTRPKSGVSAEPC